MTDTHVVVPRASTLPVTSVLHPMVERMLATNPTPEALEKLLSLQREWEKDEAKRAYDSALVELKRDLPPFLIRDKTVDYTSAKGRTHYTHTSLAGAMETVTPMLSNYGFSLTWKPGSDDKGQVTVTAKLAHRLGHSEESTLKAAPDSTGNKNGPQAVASTVTLLARYACLGLLGLATADMKEPEGEVPQNPDGLDTARNMRAMADLTQRHGKTREAVETFIGKPVKDWTGADLDKLRAWVQVAEAPISSADSAILKKIMDEFKLTPVRMLSIVSSEIGREIKGSQDIKASELPKILKAFDAVRSGAADLKGEKIEHPPV